MNQSLKQCSERNTLTDTTVHVVAPILLQYVLWVLLNARKKMITELYFLARDGYYMHQFAVQICQTYKIPIHCHYLHCSRKAWRVPSYHLDTKQAIHYICLGGKDIVLDKIFDRACLSGTEKNAMEKELGVMRTHKYNYVQLQELKKILETNQTFLAYMNQHSKEQYDNTIGYLMQEGLFRNTNYAIVDSGWTGSMQHTLGTLLKSKGKDVRSLQGFYFGMYQIPKQQYGTYHTYYFSEKDHILRKTLFNNNVFEVVYSAPEGMTTEYYRDTHKMVPKLFTEKNQNYDFLICEENYFRAVLNEAVKIEDFATLCTIVDEKMTRQLLTEFMGYPTKEEAELYGNLSFSDDITEKYLYPLAEDMSYEDFKSQLFLRKVFRIFSKKERSKTESVWMEGSISKANKQHEKYRKYVMYNKYMRYVKMGIGK